MHQPPIIVSHQNARVKQLRAAFAGQARDGRIAVEGENLVGEALRSGVRDGILFLTEAASPPASLPPGIEILRLTAEVFDRAAVTESPQGIALLFATPAPTPAPGTELILVAAGLQDPGNLGTLLRSAEAFGATQTITTTGTVSPWNQKALRSSAGSVFRMPLALTQPLAAIAALKQRGICLMAAVATGGTSFHAVNFSQPCAILIGNEGAGLSADLLALADLRITIPTPGAVESLNAGIAGSLLLCEAARQRAITRQHQKK